MFEEDLRVRIKQTPFQSKERQLLKMVLGEFQSAKNSSDAAAYNLVRSMISSNVAALKRIHVEDPCRDEYVDENETLKTLLK